MTEDQITIIDIISDAVKSINNCLQCRICLDTISSPVKTRCGHSFCRTCIAMVLNKKNGRCPLCNTNLQRRSISKDKQTEKSIKSFEKLLEAIHKDVNIDILNYKKNPFNTREGHGTPDAKNHNSSCIPNAEEKRNENSSSFLTKKITSVVQPSCSSLHQNITEDRDTTNREYMKGKITKNDGYAKEIEEGNSSLTDEMSGVYPLLSSPQLPKISTNDDIVFMKEKRIKNWLESLSNTEQFENPNGSPKLLTNLFLDDTATVVSGISLMSSVSNIKAEKESCVSDHSNYAVEEASNSTKATETSSNNATKKEKTIPSFLEREIIPNSTEHKLKYKAIHARARQRLAKVSDKKPVKDVNDSIKSSNDTANSINKQKQLESSNTTKETWNRVVKIGKEMRSKKKKLKSLDISKESTNIMRNRKLSTTNLQIDAFNREKKDESIKIEIDQEEEENIIECNSTYDKSNETIELKSLQNTSFISLEKEGRVPIMSLRREQMDDIIGVATNINESTNDQEGNSSNREDHGTIPKKRLSLRKRNDSKNSSTTNVSNADPTLSKNTPVKVNLEERYNILCDGPSLLSTRNEHTTPIKSNENSNINKSMLKLSLKKNQTINIKSKEMTAISKVTQLSNPKCNLMEKINRDELSRDLYENVNKIIDKRINKSTEKNNIYHTNTNLITNDREIRVVPFNKLGTVFKKRRKVKFYKLGHVRRESLINTLTIGVLNSYKVNMITFAESDDLLETCKTKEESNLLDHRKSTMSMIVKKDIKNNQIHLLKDRDTKSSSKNTTQDSLDVLLISLKESTNENIVNVNNQRIINYEIGESSSTQKLDNLSKNEMYSKPIITNIVKMISSEDDSQLRYLDLESMVEPIPIKLKVSNESTGLGFKIKSERNNDDTSLGQIINDKKRKLIDQNMENERRNKQIKESSDESDSDNSESVNNMTQIDKFNVGIVDKINNNENVDIARLKSESDNNMNNKKVTINALNESKKQKYKRIVTAHSSSDTDASPTRKRKIDVDENKDNKKVKISKKKDAVFEDSDDDNLVNEIVNNWCNDLDKSMKKSNSKQVKNFKTMVTVLPQSIDFDSWNNYDTVLNIIPEKEAPERSNNDIIDKVKMIKMDENDKIISNKIKGIDKLDEVETITDSLGRHFFTEDNIVGNKNQLENKDKKNILPPTNSSYMETNTEFLDDLNCSKIEENFEDTLIENFNGSNKENETAAYLINNKNDITTKKNIMSKEKDENKRTATAPAIATMTLISEKEKYEEFDKSKGQLIEQKDISCEYDSFMNVTQDQLLLKALEEDLFGAANSRSLGKSTNTKTLSQEKRLESSSQTPTKSKRNLEVTTNLYNKNAQNAKEISSDEDEIIENTPQSNKKFMETDRSIVNSKARKSLTMSQTTTPVSSKKFQQVATLKTTTTTPSLSVSSKFKTSIDQKKIQPLYQSTPKIIQTTFNRDCGASHSQDNKKSFESNANMKVESRMTRMKTKVNNKRLCFVWSSLTIDQIECIKKLASLINATWTQNFNSTVTHVVVATNEETNAATKTLKFLQGIAHRKFVISFKWIVDCLKKGTLIDEEPYEAVDCYTLEAGPRKSRLRESDLFEGFAFACIEPFQNITVTQFQDLLTAMGGTIVQNMAALSVIKNKHKIILIQSEIHRDEAVANWYNKTSAVPISCDWIVECISQYKLVSCYTHLHEVVQEEDVLKLGYPEQMIDPDEFNSTYDTSVGYKSR